MGIQVACVKVVKNLCSNSFHIAAEGTSYIRMTVITISWSLQSICFHYNPRLNIFSVFGPAELEFLKFISFKPCM